MRKINSFLITACFSVILFSACSKTEGTTVGSSTGVATFRKEQNVSLSLGGAAVPAVTKLTGLYDPNESRIERWAYWAFNDSGVAVKCGVGGSNLHAGIRLMTGTYTIVVLANYPTSGTWTVPVRAGVTKTELLNRVSELSSNAYNCFVMEGEKAVTVTDDAMSPIEVKVARLVSKVGVRRISVNYTVARLNNKITILKGIYLTNLYRTARYGSDYTSAELNGSRSMWYNTMGWHRWGGEQVSGAIDALVGDTGLSTTISTASPHTQEHYFYCYPNPSSPENDTHDTSVWSVRSTRLIIETEVDGESFYYQIQLPAMKRNTPYVAAEVVIRDLGSSDPEEFIPGTLDVVLSTAVAGWEGNYNVIEES